MPPRVSSKPRRSIKCPGCANTYDRQSKLDTHMVKVHSYKPNPIESKKNVVAAVPKKHKPQPKPALIDLTEGDDDEDIPELFSPPWSTRLTKARTNSVDIDELASTDDEAGHRGLVVTSPTASSSLVQSLLPLALKHRQDKLERLNVPLSKDLTTTIVDLSPITQDNGVQVHRPSSQYGLLPSIQLKHTDGTNLHPERVALNSAPMARRKIPINPAAFPMAQSRISFPVSKSNEPGIRPIKKLPSLWAQAEIDVTRAMDSAVVDATEFSLEVDPSLVLQPCGPVIAPLEPIKQDATESVPLGNVAIASFESIQKDGPSLTEQADNLAPLCSIRQEQVKPVVDDDAKNRLIDHLTDENKRLVEERGEFKRKANESEQALVELRQKTHELELKSQKTEEAYLSSRRKKMKSVAGEESRDSDHQHCSKSAKKRRRNKNKRAGTAAA